MTIAVVTDSTAGLPPDFAADVRIVPLSVVVDGHPAREGVEISSAEVAAALRNRRVAMTTSRPAPAEFEAVYRELLDAGADGVVSVHLSSALSGTYESAVLAAAHLPGLVEVVDSRSTAMGLGFPVLAAVAARDKDLPDVRAAAHAAVAGTDTYFVVDTLDHLRRGGRIGAASALLGTALSVKPILHVVDGAIVPCDRVRTTSRALDRLVELAVAAAADEPEVQVAVHHLDTPERAAVIADAVRAKLGDRLGALYVTEVSGVIAAHVGPGVAGVVVHRPGAQAKRPG
ncbi:DegV family protein [Hamadaea tsunoensis]|uniref:DegV family protein n=1 Tax=Hamadaea tsunoensis TaxID=53368 RepID=UPI00042392E4|nr:DegV family protein [Hamadaea tsunoensis]